MNNKSKYYTKSDLIFLNELLINLKKWDEKNDISARDYSFQMVEDWIGELEQIVEKEKCKNKLNKELVNKIIKILYENSCDDYYDDEPTGNCIVYDDKFNSVAIEIVKLFQQNIEGVLTGKDAINFIEKANAAEKSSGSIDFTKEVEITNKILDKSGIYKNGITLAGSEMNDLKKIRNYFGSHDVSSFEHFAYKFLDDLLIRFNK